MRHLKFLPFALAVAAIVSAISAPVACAETLTYANLVHRMTDLSQLAVLPAAGEQCAQWSSYDRASQYDAATGTYVKWAANNDGPNFIRQEGEQYVLAEMTGPGCIWRIWSARAEQGHVKIYLDDQPQPVVDLPFSEYFDGKHKPFDYPSLSYDLAEVGCRGQNLYMPIPYQKSCKVVADKGWGRYFHFTYTTYPKETVLPTFSTQLAAQHAEMLKAVDRFFAGLLGTGPAGKRSGEQMLKKTLRVAAGAASHVAELSGPQAITAIRARGNFRDREDEMAALRNMVLRITWDGQSKPAVCCPLGDFFGTAPGVNHYKSLPTGMTADGWYAFWYMPFGRSAVVELLNEDSAERTIDFEITHAPLGRPFEGLGHFHAKWHRDTASLPEDRFPDWTMLATQGRGRFCGVMLHVWNPRGGWWGEGDEKFFVDGEKFPSTIGTGSEDYFGYAWCDWHLFQKAYHAQTMTQSNRGHQSVLRWHVVDNVPFQKSFEGCIEKYYKNAGGTLYACTTCWYLAPDGVDSYEPVPVAERHGYYRIPEIAAAGLKILNQPQGNVRDQDMARSGRGKWKNDVQLWWTGAKPGAKLELAVPVAKSGKYQVVVNLTKAKDYGIVQLSLDGEKLGPPIDLYNPQVIPTGPMAFGPLELSEGPHRLIVEILGANEKAVKSYMFGIDRIELK